MTDSLVTISVDLRHKSQDSLHFWKDKNDF